MAGTGEGWHGGWGFLIAEDGQPQPFGSNSEIVLIFSFGMARPTRWQGSNILKTQKQVEKAIFSFLNSSYTWTLATIWGFCQSPEGLWWFLKNNINP